MALSLTAEQKCLLDIFSGKELYVIPSYQRSYSWEYEQCLKLYTDLMEAFEDDRDYFLGNVIIAKSKKKQHQPEVVDGQQRLLSLWIMFKALSALLPDIPVLKEITEVSSWDGKDKFIKIRSDVFEVNDNEEITIMSKWTKSEFDHYLQLSMQTSGRISNRVLISNIKTNIIQFYYWFNDFLTNQGQNKLESFVKFILQEVYLLPIELTAEEQMEANSKALTIFETINNRGLDLSDADIFKAKLYSKTLNESEKKEFINLWVEFKATADSLGMSIDEVFRIYMHITRGYNGKTGTEKNLRDFFTLEFESPLNKKGYKEVLQDLMDILTTISDIRAQRYENNEMSAWLQLIDYYSNQYPGYAVIVFAYHNKGIDASNPEHMRFLRAIVRYAYYLGSTTSVKFEIYNIIQQICADKPISDYYVDIDEEFFNYLGRLKYNYALLARYIEFPCGLSKWNIDKLLTGKDVHCLPKDWEGHDFYNHVDDIGNFIVIDKAKKCAIYAVKRSVYLKGSIPETTKFLQRHEEIDYKTLTERSSQMKKVLVSFFVQPKHK